MDQLDQLGRGPTKNPLTHQVADHLRELIIGGGFAEGDMLPAQADIAARFGVSKLVVREATRALEAQGLVHSEQGRRLTVARPDESQLSALLLLLVRRNDNALFELLEVRIALELHFVGLAAERATSADIQAMQAAISDLESAAKTKDVEAQANADGAFHDAVAAATGNFIFVTFMKALASALQQLRVRSLEGTWSNMGSLESVIRGHTAIVSAIHNRDPTAAVKRMAEHLSETRRDLEPSTAPTNSSRTRATG